jgi:hypothetical protein
VPAFHTARSLLPSTLSFSLEGETLRERYCVAWCEVHQEDLDCHLVNMDDILENEMDESDELRGLVHKVNNSS